MAGEKGGKPNKSGPAAKGSDKKSSGAKSGLYKLYKIEGGKIHRTNLTCPKCGAGFFMAKHKDRTTCGNCHYTEFSSKSKQ